MSSRLPVPRPCLLPLHSLLSWPSSPGRLCLPLRVTLPASAWAQWLLESVGAGEVLMGLALGCALSRLP